MAAPTPVSALVHSSTLVTAGLYILFRLVWFVDLYIKMVFLVLSLVTMFMGSLKAFLSYDRKKVVAFSTLRNLGLMGVLLFSGMVGLRYYHLILHGLSKAMLFIAVGKIMKKKTHNQDLRKFKKLRQKKLLRVFIGV
jgi:NADH-ubiquinone oxidoreductase chain 5